MDIKEESLILNKVDDNKYEFKSVYHVEMSEGEAIKNKSNIQKNIITLKTNIKELDVEKELDAERKRLENVYKMKFEALDNFDKYQSEVIRDMKLNKTKQKLQLQNEVKDYKLRIEQRLSKLSQILKHKKEQFEFQLKNDEEQILIYKDIKI